MLNSRMNVLLDYLGRWEVEAGMETAADVMKDLLKKGLQVATLPFPFTGALRQT